MAMPEVSLRELLEAGAHFGHRKERWNPRMAPYIYGVRNGIHIIDLSQTVPLFAHALQKVRDVVAGGGRVLFVGTKRQASHPVADAAQACAQYYINERWLGGTLTNWRTISNSIRKLRELEAILDDAEQSAGYTKKELLQLQRQRDKLERALGGIKNMGGLPDLLFIIDTNKEQIAVKEANKLGIPVIAILDSNSDPEGIDFPVPGNDDASRAIELYCRYVRDAAVEGLAASAAGAGDLGAMEAPPAEPALSEPSSEAETAVATEADAAATQAEAGETPAEADTEEAANVVDDVSLISGVGPVLQQKLAEAGITSLKQIAELSEDAAKELDDKLELRGRIVRDEWVEQARELLAGKPPRAKVDQAAANKQAE